MLVDHPAQYPSPRSAAPSRTAAPSRSHHVGHIDSRYCRPRPRHHERAAPCGSRLWRAWLGPRYRTSRKAHRCEPSAVFACVARHCLGRGDRGRCAPKTCGLPSRPPLYSKARRVRVNRNCGSDCPDTTKPAEMAGFGNLVVVGGIEPPCAIPRIGTPAGGDPIICVDQPQPGPPLALASPCTFVSTCATMDTSVAGALT